MLIAWIGLLAASWAGSIRKDLKALELQCSYEVARCVELAKAHQAGKFGKWSTPAAAIAAAEQACTRGYAAGCYVQAQLLQAEPTDNRREFLVGLFDLYRVACNGSLPEACEEQSNLMGQWGNTVEFRVTEQLRVHARSCAMGDQVACRRAESLQPHNPELPLLDLTAPSARFFHLGVAHDLVRMEACRIEAFERDYRLAGDLEVGFVVGLLGDVGGLEITGTGMTDERLRNCITDVFNRALTDADFGPRDQIEVVRYPVQMPLPSVGRLDLPKSTPLWDVEFDRSAVVGALKRKQRPMNSCYILAKVHRPSLDFRRTLDCGNQGRGNGGPDDGPPCGHRPGSNKKWRCAFHRSCKPSLCHDSGVKSYSRRNIPLI